jgi:glucokinase
MSAAGTNVLAIDIGGTKFSMALFEDGRMTLRESQATDREGGREWMLARIADIASTWRGRASIHRCGIGFGGPVLFDRQRVALSTHVGGWGDFDLTRHLSDLLGVPAVMDNDANVGGLGEATHGAGQGALPLFYMTLSTGIGGGIILDGCDAFEGARRHPRIYRGADSYAGEIGHICIQPGGPECLCGARGCFERLCSGLWIERGHGRGAQEMLQDPLFVRRYAADLAAGLKTCIMLLNPARIVIGGGIAKAGGRLFDPLREELRRQSTSWSRARIDVQPAALGDDSVLYGAFELAQQIESGAHRT